MSATRGDFTRVLKDSTPGADARRSRLQGGFVVAQISMSLVLLVTAGMFLTSLYKASRINVGFDATHPRAGDGVRPRHAGLLA